METAVKLHYLRFGDTKTYLFSVVFIAGNIILPQVCHLIPGGGLVWLPIYFFTLIGAYKYGLTVGMLTALLSPLVNSLIFGMPPVSMLPAILVKSILLAGLASVIAAKAQRITIPFLLAIVLGYQLSGMLIEWLISGDFSIAIQDFRVGIPGMLVQIFGGYLLLKAIRKL